MAFVLSCETSGIHSGDRQATQRRLVRNQNTGEIKTMGELPGKETDMNSFEMKNKRKKGRKGGRHGGRK